MGPGVLAGSAEPGSCASLNMTLHRNNFHSTVPYHFQMVPLSKRTHYLSLPIDSLQPDCVHYLTLIFPFLSSFLPRNPAFTASLDGTQHSHPLDSPLLTLEIRPNISKTQWTNKPSPTKSTQAGLRAQPLLSRFRADHLLLLHIRTREIPQSHDPTRPR